MNNKSRLLGITLLAGIVAYLLYANSVQDNPATDDVSAHHPVSLPTPQNPHPQEANATAQTPEPPMDPALRAALNEMLSTSSEDLEIEEKDGVTSINLQGRFRTVPVATIDEHGDIHIREYSSPPGNQ